MRKPTEVLTDTPPLSDELTEPVTIPVEAYISEEYVRAERDKLWRKVWLQVGRVEEIPEVGSFLTEDERRSLAARLKQVVGNMNESPALR